MKNTRFVSVLALALLACCCSRSIPPPRTVKLVDPPPLPKIRTYRFHVDKGYSPPAIEIMQRAAGVWEKYTKGLARFEWVQDVPQDNEEIIEAMFATVPTIMGVNSTDQIIVAQDTKYGVGVRTLGLTLRAPGPPPHPIVLFVMDRLHDARDFYVVAIHELGHAIGIEHVKDPTSVMYAEHVVWAAQCPHKQDMESFCKANACILSDVKWCED